VHRITDSIPEATGGNPLSGFARDPTKVFNPRMKLADLWEGFLNLFMKSNLGWDTSIPAAHLVQHGDLGLSALLRFVEYFVLEQGVDWELFDGKHRKQKVHDVGDLSQCFYREAVSAKQRSGGAAVKCRRQGCETNWVSQVHWWRQLTLMFDLVVSS
jgi:hypothetical protein